MSHDDEPDTGSDTELDTNPDTDGGRLVPFLPTRGRLGAEPDVQGYVQCATNSGDGFGARKAGLLLLPTEVADELLEKHKAQQQLLRDIRLERQLMEAKAPSPPTPGKTWQPSPHSHQVPWPDADPWLTPPTAGMVRIWDPDHVWTVIEEHNSGTRTREKDMLARDAAVLRKLLATGPWRQLSSPPADCVRTRLQLACLHMGQVIDVVCNALHLAAVGGTAPRIPPLLLVGPPGVGKTHFARELASALGTALHVLDMAVAQTAARLRGSDRHWSNTEHGLLADALLLSGERFANPVILVDEIDKAKSGGSNGYDPLKQLLAAIEPSTAVDTVDQSLGITFDASHVIYIATANSLQGLPTPLLTRFKIILCQMPTVAESLVLTRRLLQDLCIETGCLVQGVDREVVQELAGLPPRAVLQIGREAIARAVAAGRHALGLRDLLPPDPTDPQMH